jgi:hypothetical protein
MTRGRPTVPRALRQVARAARLTLREVAWAVLAGQPPRSAPRDHTALRWLGMSVASANAGIDAGELAEQVVPRLRGMAETGDRTAKAVMEAQRHEIGSRYVHSRGAAGGYRGVGSLRRLAVVGNRIRRHARLGPAPTGRPDVPTPGDQGDEMPIDNSPGRCDCGSELARVLVQASGNAGIVVFSY